LLEHAAPSAIAPAGSDLRVVARVRMVTPGRGTASMRVAMRVTVTEQDEDERSLARAIGQAVRTLALVALLLAALAAGAQAHGRGPGLVPFGGGHEDGHAAVVAAADSSPGSTGSTRSAGGDVQAIEPPTAPLPAALAGAPSSPVRPESQRLPRPALVAGVVPSPD
jgi:hypothetical protein